ncbi:restriction endonuclease subunit S [Nocardia salmonicida]|uniref:restriction endonuclease subunit S n=1 Tax=Nocardia salmonicida TaxID=53431 RepID=UPI00371158F5
MSHYPTRQLGEICSIVSGGTPSRKVPDNFGGDVPWVKIGDMLQGVVRHTDERITADGLNNSAAKMLPQGTVLISIFATVGRTAVLGIDAATNQAIAGLIVKDELLVDSVYLRQFLDSYVATIVGRARGVAQVNINLAILKSIPIPLPSLDEQRRIADVLDRVDDLRAKRRKSIALLDDLTQSIFLDMFGEPSAGGTYVTVAELANASAGSIRTGPFGSQLLHEEFTNTGIPVLGIDNTVDNEFVWGKSRFITEEKYQQLSRYTVRPGDVVITIMGTLGRCVVVPDDIPVAINTKHLCCITLNQDLCLPEYLHSYFLLHSDAQRYLTGSAKGAIMAGLNMGIIRKMPVHVPPIARQKEYRTRIRTVRALKDAHITDLAHLDALFSSLQSRAFKGDLWKDDTKHQEGE